ncbi:MAG TPA: glycosyltransferase family 1 protein [Dongiaceae bacterium]|nr:glycosyltransferase family 1 protein [Dongiaceae bacterium]
MIVGLDARKLRDGGIGSYIRGLLSCYAAAPGDDRFVAIVAPADHGRTRWPGSAVTETVARAGKYGLLEHVVVPAAARHAGVQLLHAPHYTLPLGWSGPAVVTIHDLIHLQFPSHYPPGASLYARAMAGMAARNTRLVLVDSIAARDDVIARLHAPASKLRVVPLGVAAGLAPPPRETATAWRASRGLPADYVLYVGARKRHKNLELLIDAWGAMTATERPPLVLSGGSWRAGDPLARRARARGVEPAVHFSGALVGDSDLACLYAGAMLYVQPSLAEGFGLPPLEAMACGAPVLSSDAGALPEVLNGAARLLPPRDPEAWAAAVTTLLGDPAERGRLVAAGLARAARFTWERCAELTRAAYAEAMS